MDKVLRICTLGGLTLEYGGKPLTGITTRKTEALLVYLACTGRTHAREVLAEMLWPERSQSQSLASLRSSLSNLHRVLPSHVHITRHTVSLDSESACWLDVTEFEHQLSLAGVHKRRDTVLSEDEAQALRKALDLYQGGFLEGFYIADSRAFEEWAQIGRERLQRIVIEALHHLVLYDLEFGSYVDGIAQATRLLPLDPLHEEINRHLIVLLAKAGQRTQAIAQYETYCRLLEDDLGAKPSPDLVALIQQIHSGTVTMAGTAAVISEPADPLPVPVLANPYKGLRPFQETDAPDFFGREEIVRRLCERLRETRFLAVVGPSGCGKSSLVRAGLIPALRQGTLPNSDHWQIVTIMPGTHPGEELSAALRRLAPQLDARLWSDLEQDTRGLLRIAKHVLPEDSRAELLLVIDQFEEIFSLVGDDNARSHFLESLLTALREPHSRVRAVVTLRADFYDRPLHYAALGDMIRQWTEVVLPLTPEELEQAISGPAKRVGVQVEPTVVTEMVADVNRQPGALPLLQYSLTQLFEHRTDNALTLATYRATGGVRGTLASTADSIYVAQREETQRLTRQIFLRLVHLSEGTEDTRRRVPWAEAVSVAGSEVNVHTSIDAFVRHRLLTLDHDPVAGNSTIELAHEALIREWQRFHTWIDESRADLRLQRMLAHAAREWITAGKDRSYLLTGSRLAQFGDWVSRTDLALTPDERAFVDASNSERQRERARRRRIRNLTLAVTVAVSVVMAILALVALGLRSTAQKQRDQAEQEAAVNRSLMLAANAEQEFEAGDVDLALLLALEAVNIDQPPQEAISALSSVGLGPGTRAVLTGHRYPAQAAVFSPDNRWALSGGCAQFDIQSGECLDGEIILWDLEKAAELRRLTGHSGQVNGVAFSPDGQTALSASDDGTLMLWDVVTGRVIRQFEGHTGGVNSVAFSPDGQTAISGSADNTLILWELETGEALRRFGTSNQATQAGERHTGGVNTVAFSADGQQVVSGSDDWTLILWDVARGELVRRFEGHTNSITAAAFVPGAEQDQVNILSASRDYSLRLWDAETGAMLQQRIDFQAEVTDLAIVPNESRAWVGIIGDIQIFDVEGWRTAHRYTIGGPSGLAMAVSPDGSLALSGYTDGTLRLWNMREQSELLRITPSQSGKEATAWLALRDNGTRLLISTLDLVGSQWNQVLWDIDPTSPTFNQAVTRTSLLDYAGGHGTYSSDGRYLVMAYADWSSGTGRHALVVHEAETGQEIRRFEGQQYYSRSAAFSPDGRTVLGGSMCYTQAWPQSEWGNGELFLWDVATGDLIRRFENADDVTSIQFSQDGRRALTSSSFHPHIDLWDLATGNLIRQCAFPSGNAGGTYRVRFGPDESTALGGSGYGPLYLWDLETCEVKRRFIGHNGTIWDIEFSPDGRSVLSSDSAGNIFLWDFDTGHMLRPLGRHQGAAVDLLFSADGQTAWSASYDGTVRQWQVGDWPLEDLLAWVRENRYIREFTCDERVRYRIEPLCGE